MNWHTQYIYIVCKAVLYTYIYDLGVGFHNDIKNFLGFVGFCFLGNGVGSTPSFSSQITGISPVF